MIITPTNTHWVLVWGMKSEKKMPDRFFFDAFFAYNVLLNAGVPIGNLELIVEASENPTHPLLIDFFSKIKVHSSSDFSNIIQNNHLENLMIVFNGHGDINGLNSTNQLKPYELISEIHKRAHLQYCAVVFGQCFAGIYNYIDVIKKDHEGKSCKEPIVCFIGASHLNSSISGSASLGEVIRWTANIFLFHFFKWFLEAKKDIDGDGLLTLTDAFKYAGAQGSSHLISLKYDAAMNIQKAFKSLEDVEKKLKEFDKTEENEKIIETCKIEEESIKKTIEERLGISHTNQDPWILNANKARDFIFAY